MPIKVAIVEDDARFRESLAIMVGGADGFACTGSFPNAETALKEIPRQWPDVVLMDINLPNMSGIECVTKLKAARPALQCIMVTVYVDNQKIFESLKAGASGYLIKKTAPTKILEAISDVHAGGSPMSNPIARRVVQFFQQIPPATEKTASLTAREEEVLKYLAKGYQYKEIAETLTISVETVWAHVRKIYEKLHVRSRTEAVVKYLGRTDLS